LDLSQVKTVSITSVQKIGNKMRMKYHDLLTGPDADQSITLS